MTAKKNRIYCGLKETIITNVLKPGQIVNEADIAREYGVSKTPAREALHELAYEGYISPLARTGYMVTHISLQDIQEGYHLRQVLEVEAAGLAATRIGEEIATLEKTAADSVLVAQPGNGKLRTNEESSLDNGFQLNREFHLIIARASGNNRLARLIEQLLDEMQRIIAFDPYMVLPSATVDISEHLNIIVALKTRDEEEARAAMKNHIDKAHARVLERF